MKTKLLFFLILTTLHVNCLFSQSIYKLDEKNGFQNFKLGDDISKWQTDLTFLQDLDGKGKKYLYKGDCCKSIFKKTIVSIVLKFYSNKLRMIIIETQKFDIKTDGKYIIYSSDPLGPNYFQSFFSSFEELFGKYTYHTNAEENQDGSISNQIQWIGNNVRLIVQYNWYGTLIGDNATIVVIDNKWSKANLEKDF